MENVNSAKKKFLASGISFICALVFLCFAATSFAADIKEPNVSGTFYPDNPAELTQVLDDFLALANPQPLTGNIIALISPHAGYGYSGQVAAYGYKLIKNKPFKTVVVIGTSHRYGFSGASVYPEGIFKTPLGDLEIDKEFAQKLLDKDKEIYFEPQAFSKEHSVEVQLPFLQRSLPSFSAEGGPAYGWKIVPIVMGDCPLYTCRNLANLLKDAIGTRQDVLVVVSTDMYHGYNYEDCEKTDALTLSFIKNMDPEGLYNGLRQGELQLCGGFGVITTLFLAKDLGHNKAVVLNYTNSAVITGNKNQGNWTVGYVSCIIDQEKKGELPMLNKNQKKKLLGLARKSIETYLKTNNKLEVANDDPILAKEAGAFVTLHKSGKLKGCIGNLAGREPVYLIVQEMAIAAATNDWRFSPVELSELKDIEIEISVLSPLERIDNADKIQMGVHGVVIRKGTNSGVYLPQVALDTRWSKEEFLSSLCVDKAGLPADAWKDPSTEIYIFTAEVFSEKELAGE